MNRGKEMDTLPPPWPSSALLAIGRRGKWSERGARSDSRARAALQRARVLNRSRSRRVGSTFGLGAAWWLLLFGLQSCREKKVVQYMHHLACETVVKSELTPFGLPANNQQCFSYRSSAVLNSSFVRGTGTDPTCASSALAKHQLPSLISH